MRSGPSVAGVGRCPSFTALRRELAAGLVQGALIAGAALAAMYLVLGAPSPRGAAQRPASQPAVAPPVAALGGPSTSVRRVDFGAVQAPADVAQLAGWAVSAADNGDRSFVVVDKRRAHIYVFAAGGRLLGHSPVLLGYAAGDHSVAGIGDRPIALVKPHERTTPAGRFRAEPGRNTLNENVVWVDYAAAVSMHRVRATQPAERRLERLATPSAADNRISWGCINVPVAFFDSMVWPHIGKGRGIVYVLPEKSPLTDFFPAASRTQAPRQYAQAGATGDNSRKP